MHKKPYNIVHLSDLHLTPGIRIGRTEVSAPGRNLHGMNSTFRTILQTEEVQSADALLVTGDVTDAGDRASWQVFRKAIQKYVPDHHTLVVAGNHDVCEMERGFAFSDLFGALTQAKQRAKLVRLAGNLELIDQPAEYPWSAVLNDEHKRVMVIALDSNHSGHFSLADNAVGRIGQEQLDELEAILKKCSDPQKRSSFVPVRIVTIHHSPNIPRYDTLVKRGILPKRSGARKMIGKSKGLFVRWTHQIPAEERRRLRELCAKYRVRLIAHGHMHEAMDRRVNGVRIIGAPASTQPMPGRGKKRVQFYRYSVRGNGGRLEPTLVTVEV